MGPKGNKQRPPRRVPGFVRAAVVKGGVMAGVAGALAFSLVVTVPSTAQAFVNPPSGAAGPPVISGPMEGVPEGAVAAGEASGPAGWALDGAAAIGIGLYSFMNSLMDWHPGMWGMNSYSNNTGTGPSPSPSPTSSTGTIRNGDQCPSSGCGDLSQAPTWDAYGTAIGTQGPVGGVDVTGAILAGDQQGHANGGIEPQIHYSGSYANGFNVEVEVRGFCQDTSTKATYYFADISSNQQYVTPGATVNGNWVYPCKTDGSQQVIGYRVDQARSAVMQLWGSPSTNWYTSEASGFYTWGQQSTAPAEPPFDPKSSSAHYTTTVDCVRSDGTGFTVSADWTGDQAGAVIPSCKAVDPSSHGKDVSVVGTDPNTGLQTPLWQDNPTTTTSAPDCDPSRGTTSPCKLAVWVDGTECVIGAWQCVNWTQINSENPNRVQCKFGPYTMATADCSALERAYETNPVWGTQANTDGNPSTQNNSVTNSSGQPQPSNPPSDVVNGTAGAPASGAQASPNVDPNSKDCYPSGWAAFNPLQWVYQPVMCAMRDAFVPQTSTVTKVQTEVQTDVDQVGFKEDEQAVELMFQPIASGGSGCAGPTIHFGFGGVGQDVQPFNACTEPLATAAAVSNAVCSMVLVVMGGLVFLKALSAAFGYQFSIGSKGGAA